MIQIRIYLCINRYLFLSSQKFINYSQNCHNNASKSFSQYVTRKRLASSTQQIIENNSYPSFEIVKLERKRYYNKLFTISIHRSVRSDNTRRVLP